MKRLFKSISLTSLLLLVVSQTSFAKAPRGIVSAIKGNVFITQNGETKKLDVGHYLYDFDQIFTEVGSQLSFNDYNDHVYHVSGSGHISLLNQLIELKGGYLWVQSLEKSDEKFMIQTVNSTVTYDSGEFVVSYDTDSGKTQLLGIKGDHVISNNVNPFLKEEVSTGKFSFISEKYENGAPRMATPIGSSAYSAVLSLYDGIKPMQHQTPTINEKVDRFPQRRVEITRSVASVKTTKGNGSLIIRKKKNIDPSIRQNSLEKYYQSKVTKLEKKYKKKPYKFKPEYLKKSGVIVKVYRLGRARRPASVVAPVIKKKMTVRAPASMTVLNPQVSVKQGAFETSLMREYKKQMRHSKEINSLIR